MTEYPIVVEYKQDPYAWNPPPAREQWLKQITDALRPQFMAQGKPLPTAIQLSFGFPAQGQKSPFIGQCHYTPNGPHIFIHPNQDEPLDIAGILLHELVHAALGPGYAHGKEFKALATAMGLEGKMKSATPGEKAKESLKQIINALQPFHHKPLKSTLNIRTIKSLNQQWVNLRCANDDFFAKGLVEQLDNRLCCPICGERLLTKEERAEEP